MTTSRILKKVPPKRQLTPLRFTLQHIKEFDPRLYRRLGLSKASYASQGVNGKVWVTRRHAIKVTWDSFEVAVARKFIGCRSKYLMRVTSVHKIRGKNFWLIRTERLVPANLARCQAHPHVIAGREYLRRRGFMHVDLHARNVMWCDRTSTHKLIDYGGLTPRSRRNDG